ncbi:phosphoethanolamine transferase [Colwellia sp. 12G3]|uniref:phosphoethanolamine transferase n=1 Tax=Colwellia sp. 12G3 TaxID=2058299 RepID=UPI001E2EF6A5|nr:phosphoethanolamine--lipid A transferase [Colwellia sp. 12G3]
MTKFFSKTLSLEFATILLSFYFALIFNFPFLHETYLDLVKLDNFDLAYFISLPLFLTSVFIVLFSLLPKRVIYKTVLMILIFLSAIFCYASSSYGIIFDYGMVENMAETSTSEAFTYLNSSAILFVTLLIITPLAILFKINPKQNTFKVSVNKRLKLISPTLAIFFIIVFSLYSSYASVNRNNRELVKYIVPIPTLISSYKYVNRNYFYEPTVFKLLDETPTLKTLNNKDKNVIVMIVGETARAKNFSLNGYPKQTNEYTEKLNIQSFQQMYSCGTATAVSVPCMFSLLNKEQFNKRSASSQQNLLDIVELAGVDVLWIDNNEGCKGVCKRVKTINIDKNKSNPLCDGDYCFDEILLTQLDNKLANLSHQTTLIVLHLMGSHGPTYYRRYPHKFATFLPDCQQSDIQNCTSEQLVNTYDNTIHYSDYVIAEVVNKLTSFTNENAQTVNAEMIYVSDHGESLGEHGLYLHGLPYAIAPSEQTHIPMLFWSNNITSNMNTDCALESANTSFNHDNMFHSMLGLLNVESSTYQTKFDIFNSCNLNTLDIAKNLLPINESNKKENDVILK